MLFINHVCRVCAYELEYAHCMCVLVGSYVPVSELLSLDLNRSMCAGQHNTWICSVSVKLCVCQIV